MSAATMTARSEANTVRGVFPGASAIIITARSEANSVRGGKVGGVFLWVSAVSLMAGWMIRFCIIDCIGIRLIGGPL